MNRPYIFCHMMTSLDGKIMGDYMETPEGEQAGSVFYDIAFGKNAYYKHQGWLSGRVTTDDIDEFNGPRGDFYKNMFAKCPAGRPGTADEVANMAELLMSDRGAFITGADFLIDGGATASYFYGPLKP